MRSDKEGIGWRLPRWCLLLLCALPSGCVVVPVVQPVPEAPSGPQAAQADKAAAEPVRRQGMALTFEPPAATAPAPPQPSEAPFTGEAELSRR
jgi:hypothetical protein